MKNQLKNKKGSALAYVLIFGMVIMILVMGLLSAAQGGVSFTLQSVENRQAYIDAKSVIEFGKIEIDGWAKSLAVFDKRLDQLEKELEQLKEEYAALSGQEEVDQSALKAKQDEIDAKKKEIIDEKTEKNKEFDKGFVIYANPDKLSETLKILENPAGPPEKPLVKVGDLPMVKGEKEDIDDETSKVRKNLKYEFNIETENLRRILDYEVTFAYKEGGGSASVPEMPKPPTRPSEPVSPFEIELGSDSIKWTSGSVFTESQQVHAKFDDLDQFDEIDNKLTINGPSNSLEIKEKFEWINEKTLDMTAHNIKLSQAFPTKGVNQAKFNFTAVRMDKTPGLIRIVKAYNQKNQELNTMTADTIIFADGLTLGYDAKLEIKCKTLYINGDVNLSSTNTVLDIMADDIIITGNLSLGSGATMMTKKSSDLTNVWIKGKTIISSNGSSIQHLNLNYLSSGDIDLQSGTELVLECRGLSKVEIKNVKVASSNVNFAINEVNYLEIGDIAMGQNNQMTIKGAEGKSNNYLKAGSVEANSGNGYKFKATGLAFFICQDLKLNDSSTLELESDCVLIKDELSLVRTGNPTTIKTDYFDVSGETSINRINGLFSIKPLRSNDLKVRFKGGYEQENSKVLIDQANMVIFADEFDLDSDSASDLSLKVQADDILINSEMEIEQHWYGSYSNFEYAGKNSGGSNLHLQNDFIWSPQDPSYTIQRGTYKDVYGNFPDVKNKVPKMWLYELEPDGYDPSGSVSLRPDKEQYSRGGS